ncbi:MAG: penicillin acylase family protein [Desulfarculus sp.]|nr:penicillin acylase family protein [Desulfarculus sp.]
MGKWFRRLLGLALLLALAGAALYFYLPRLNGYQQDGSLDLPGLQYPVTVTRDEKGMAHIQAQSLEDAVLAQGFVTAQDRIFQMQTTKMFVEGRLGEFLGDRAGTSDRLLRTLGFKALAQRQYQALGAQGRLFFERYAQGVNAFLERCPGDLPLEFTLAGVKPEPWRPQDSLALLYYIGYSTSGNLTHELMAQALVDKLGPEKARGMMPLNINPDDPDDAGVEAAPPPPQALGLEPLAALAPLLQEGPYRLGSNNWAVSPERSQSGRAMLAGDPHLDARLLPGPWYPLGLAAPGLRVVGVNMAGLPGIALGRTNHLAISMTNNYGDTQDLYLEALDPADPGRYLEGGRSLPFEVSEETLLFRDKQAPGGLRQEKLLVRRTSRGPVVSGLMSALKGERVLTLRWSPAEKLVEDLGLMHMLTAASAAEMDRHLTRVPMLCLNWVFADTAGNIGHRVSGALPLRREGGAWPYPVGAGGDNWRGWIPPEQMPHESNPARGWLGTCNQKVVPHDYPHYYSNFFASGHRYRRLKELLDAPGARSADDFWRHQRDVKSLLAAQVAPAMARELSSHADTAEMGQVLAGWDFEEGTEAVAPSIFNLTWYNFARLLYEPDLGPELTRRLLNDLYFWEERLARDVQTGVYPPGVNAGELWRRAALETKAHLQEQLGAQPADWRWGRLHYLELISVLRREGWGKELLGSGRLPLAGSAATLLRGRPALGKDMGAVIMASLRMVADLGDPDKVLAVIPGGVCERLFSPHRTDQVEAFMSGHKLYWWFSQEALDQHARHRLNLVPAQDK